MTVTVTIGAYQPDKTIGAYQAIVAAGTVVSIGTVSLIMAGQALTLLDTIPITNTSITIAGQALSISINNQIIIENAPLSIVGQSLLLLDIVPVGNVCITLAGQGIIVLNRLLVEPDSVSITITGQLVLLKDTVSIAGTDIVISHKRPKIFVWGIPPSFELEELVPNPEKDPSHEPCGHWHLGIADEPEWDFVEQADLPIPYHEHPTKPEVCGHWHKGPIVITEDIPCIEFVDTVEISATAGPTWGNYESNEALLYSDGYLYFGAANVMYLIDTDTMQVVTATTFDTSDILGIYQTLEYDGDLYLLITRSGYSGRWIQKMTKPVTTADFELIGDPLYAGQVVLETDGKIYGCRGSHYANTYWIEVWRPINSSLFWEELPSDYSYYIHSNIYDAEHDDRICGAGLVNFLILSSGDYIGNNGPTSGASASAWTTYCKYDLTNGQYIFMPGTTTNGVDEIVLNPIGKNRIAAFGHVAWGSLRLETADVDSIDHNQTVITGLLDPDGNPEDRSVYHGKTMWYTNDRIYTLHHAYLKDYNRIICCDPEGSLLYQFSDMSSSYGSYTILGDYVYVWAKDGDVVEEGMPSVGRIIKLTLDLEFVCHIRTQGGEFSVGLSKYLEWPGQYTNDGNQYLYSFHKWPGESGYISKYQVNPIVDLGDAVVGDHDPRWDFTKQPIKL